jgi:hypothetical protein
VWQRLLQASTLDGLEKEAGTFSSTTNALFTNVVAMYIARAIPNAIKYFNVFLFLFGSISDPSDMAKAGYVWKSV